MQFSGRFFAMVAMTAAVSAPSVAAPLSDLDRLLIERACAAIEVAHARYLDLGNIESLAAAFGEEGVMVLQRGTFAGRDAILRRYADRAEQKATSGIEGTKHVITNLQVEALDADRAIGRAYITVYRYDAGSRQTAGSLAPAVIGAIESEYMRTPDGWRYKSRRLVESISVAP